MGIPPRSLCWSTRAGSATAVSQAPIDTGLAHQHQRPDFKTRPSSLVRAVLIAGGSKNQVVEKNGRVMKRV